MSDATQRPAFVVASTLGLTMEEQPHEGVGVITARASNAASLVDDPGNFRVGALLAFADSVAGLAASLAALPDKWCVTTNQHLRMFRTHGPLPVHARTTVWRAGRTSVVSGAELHDNDGNLVASVMQTNAALVPEFGIPVRDRPWRLHAEPGVPLHEVLALTTIPHGVQLEVRDQLRNPWGILHGGVTGYLADRAARTLQIGMPHDTVLHFLRPGRVGPVTATATALGTHRTGQVVRVEIRDEGADRVMAVATMTTG
ncbi:MAG: hotdog domain-containing protein [Acidimicrobiia bacterium]